MLNVSPTNLLSEVLSARAYAEGMHRSVREMREAYAPGMADFTQNPSPNEKSPENHYYEYVSLVTPKVCYDVPRVRCRSRRGETYAGRALAMEHALNRWCKDVELRRVLVDVCVDMLFSLGVTLTTLRPRPGVDPRGRDRSPMRPTVTRLPPSRFFMDPLATDPSKARFMGHVTIRDKQDLLKDPSYDRDAIEAIAPDAGIDEVKDGADRRRLSAPTRNEIVLYEVWVPEHRLSSSNSPDSDGGRSNLSETYSAEEGFHGTLFTLAAGGSPSSGGRSGANVVGGNQGVSATPESKEQGREGLFVREPVAYYGPPWGPYSLFQVYPVPDKGYRLSPLMAVKTQIEDTNTRAREVQNAMRNYRRVAIVDSKNEKLVRGLRGTPSDFLIPIPGFDPSQVTNVEYGGVTDTLLKHMDVERERLERVSGISEAKRGAVQGRGTATEHAIADATAETKAAGLRQAFSDAVTQVLKTASWYMFLDDRFAIYLDQDAATQLKMNEPIFEGGLEEGETAEDWWDLELEIEPYSMERVSEAVLQKRAQDLMTVVTQIGPLVPQLPWVQWDQVLDVFGDAINIPNLGRMLDMQAAQAEQQRLQQMQGLDMQAKQLEAMGMGGGGGASGAPSTTGPVVAPPQMNINGSGGVSPTGPATGPGQAQAAMQAAAMQGYEAREAVA